MASGAVREKEQLALGGPGDLGGVGLRIDERKLCGVDLRLRCDTVGKGRRIDLCLGSVVVDVRGLRQFGSGRSEVFLCGLERSLGVIAQRGDVLGDLCLRLLG